MIASCEPLHHSNASTLTASDLVGIMQKQQGFSLAHVPQGASMLAPPAYTLYHHAASYGGSGSNSSGGNGGEGARAWQQQCGSKGTGVFIPRLSPGSARSKKKDKNKGGSSGKARGAGGERHSSRHAHKEARMTAIFS